MIAALRDSFYASPFAVINVEIVGPKVGSELRRQAIYVTLYALAGMLVYIAFRFEWVYGAAAVLAVFHDVLITLGLFSLLHFEISLTVIAALLTLVGYSMNDTIVIFDRIRENVRLMRREPFAAIVNRSINQTLSRTILTSGLTFLTVLVLFIMGGDVLRSFSFALVVGILVGTYSSFGIAAPLVVAWNQLEGPGRGAGFRIRSRHQSSDGGSDTHVWPRSAGGNNGMFDDLVESSVVKKKTNKSWAIILSTIVQVARPCRLDLDPADLYAGVAEGDAHDAVGRAAATATAATASAGRGSHDRQAGRQAAQPGRVDCSRRPSPSKWLSSKKRNCLRKRSVAASLEELTSVVEASLAGWAGASGAAPPPPPPPPPPKPTAPIKVGGNVQEAMVIARPNPVYPPLARQARIQGNVVLHAIIDKDGKVSELQVISGHPLLGAVGARGREELALSAHPAERRCGRGRYHHYRQFCAGGIAGPVTARLS